MLRLSEKEELELIEKYQKYNDMAAYKRLRISLRPLIRSAIKRQMPSSNEMSESQIAIRIDSLLPQFLKEYDAKSGVKLSTFLTSKILGHARNTISENKLGPHVPRPEHTQLSRYRQAKRQAVLEFGPNPTEAQILKMNPLLKDVAEVKRIAQYDRSSLIGDAKHGNEDDGFVAFKDQFSDGLNTSGDQDLSLKLDDLRKIQKEFPEQDQKVIEEYVFNERSIVDTALRTGVTSSRVRTVMKHWKKKVDESGVL